MLCKLIFSGCHDQLQHFANALVGGLRRRALPPVVRDMERCLGRMDIHPEALPLDALIAGIFGADAAQQRVG